MHCFNVLTRKAETIPLYTPLIHLAVAQFAQANMLQPAWQNARDQTIERRINYKVSSNLKK